MGDDDSASTRFEELKQQYEETGGFEDTQADSSASSQSQDTEDSAVTDSEASVDDTQRTTDNAGEPDTPPASEQPQSQTTGEQPVTEPPQTPDPAEETSQTQTAAETDSQPQPTPVQESQTAPPQETAHDQATGRPYVEPIPGGYWAERRVLEWLEFLVATGGTAGAADAIDFYRSVGWIGPRAEARLKEYLAVFPETTTDQSITYDDHRQSLEYIAALRGQPNQW